VLKLLVDRFGLKKTEMAEDDTKAIVLAK